MRKIVGFELKKLVSRIGIYILALLLAGLLVASAYMYKPENPTITPAALAGETVTEMYTNFEMIKNMYEEVIDNVSSNADTYVTQSTNHNKYNIKKTLMDKLETFDDLCLLYTETSTATKPDYPTLVSLIKQSLVDLNANFNAAFDYKKDDGSYYILTTNENYSKLKSLLNSIPHPKCPKAPTELFGQWDAITISQGCPR